MSWQLGVALAEEWLSKNTGCWWLIKPLANG